jgi:hypothetical protein
MDHFRQVMSFDQDLDMLDPLFHVGPTLTCGTILYVGSTNMWNHEHVNWVQIRLELELSAALV